MAGGYKSLLAPWIGGASANPAAAVGGVRSLLAPWIGGAAASATAQTGGRRSLLAFWMGGATSGIVVSPTSTDVYPGSGHPGGIWWGERKIRKGKRLDDILKKAMEHLLEESIELPRGSPAARAVEIVKPFVAHGTDRIDWSGIETDLARVRELLQLWQEQANSLEDEEILLMLMA